MKDFDRTTELDELQLLRAENARLKALLEQHHIDWNPQPISDTEVIAETLKPHDSQFSTNEKIRLFRRLFQGRTDVYPLRWESSTGKSGYSPACDNEWKPGICNKPQIKCSDCNQRLLLPVTDQVIYDHLVGKHTVGIYPLLSDDHCYFLAVDFDEANWQEDSRAFMRSCIELNIPTALEISRSGKGAHAWIFFASPVPAREARQLGAALISYTCDRTRQLSLSSYDRLFPNQDTLPKGGFGNLIALPLQKQPREHGYSLFVDENFVSYPDQWTFLSSLHFLSLQELEQAILQASGGKHPLDVSFLAEEDESKPWQQDRTSLTSQIAGPLPESLTLVLANQIFIEKSKLPQSLINRLIRLAAFQNPEFYKAQAMRLPVWNKPRLIGCAENFVHHIGLPRGCLDALLDLLQHNNVRVEIQDERITGCPIPIKFMGTLTKEQEIAHNVMLNQEMGILYAPTAFGKTVTAAALIATRQISTLILVHRANLLHQWKERLTTFLNVSKENLGVIGGGQNKPTGQIDIAIIQSLSRRKDLSEFLEGYGQIIVDECHHLSAFSFESVLKQTKSKYIMGLTATHVRRDGHHPIIFMQCGPIRHSVTRSEALLMPLEVWPRIIPVPSVSIGANIQEVFRILMGLLNNRAFEAESPTKRAS